jgi:spore coat polysaccharide biosynthesis protein SpsF
MILALLQARYSSSRLPGKVLKPILGKPMLFRQVERLKRARLIDRLIIVTSIESSDDIIESACQQEGLEVVRGSLNDVLDRFYQAALPIQPRHVVRLTADCPLADPQIIDATIEKHIREGLDYTSSSLEPTFPDGLDVEVMTFQALERAWKESELKSDREHVTPYLYRGHALSPAFRVGAYKGSRDLSSLRWTVDEPSDFLLISKIYEALYPTQPEFSTADVLNYLENHPDLSTLNSLHQRNEGFQKSLEQEKRSK